MTRRLISSGSPFEAEVGYSRAVVQGDWCFMAGVTGFDYTTMTLPDTIAAQARQCFVTIDSVLNDAGFTRADIVRVTHYVTDRALVDELKPVLSEHLGTIRPAATMVIADLMTPEMLYEIEVTAFQG
ncbi:RidA family protein [Thalassobacter stenotrophicus]|mgnify:FL=1|uniref:Enamine/imine deaminase n=2 Tax=Thalassobacter stenotrophicus TaxID=266809 RepID=A0A0N7LTF9_9RHOB|nr:RidA family protein [Thalassobacter stenotrophicus]PVZ49538.1 RidA family protein [Thalassobacter stenotrophicus]CUH60586.1 Enamine/imine deaminase [Thalassobacter stenotrophicus]SHJ24582.1 Enamine deaminase RidA, house cleaning of reactive enamine intermediates, YjgF/YER057c/UK114 family [Thalassobacter stenotrophicus DSM 16310]